MFRGHQSARVIILASGRERACTLAFLKRLSLWIVEFASKDQDLFFCGSDCSSASSGAAYCDWGRRMVLQLRVLWTWHIIGMIAMERVICSAESASFSGENKVIRGSLPGRAPGYSALPGSPPRGYSNPIGSHQQFPHLGQRDPWGAVRPTACPAQKTTLWLTYPRTCLLPGQSFFSFKTSQPFDSFCASPERRV